jgi:hypothetical protein
LTFNEKKSHPVCRFAVLLTLFPVSAMLPATTSLRQTGSSMISACMGRGQSKSGFHQSAYDAMKATCEN